MVNLFQFSEQYDSVLEPDGFSFLFHKVCPCRDAIIKAATGNAPPEKVFKQVRRRNVFLYQGCIIKRYTFRKLSDILHSRRYGPLEFSCNLHYNNVFGNVPGIRIPKLYAFFSKPKWHWLYDCNGIALEFIPDTRYLRPDEINRAIPLFVNLYRHGIYHPDMWVSNILVSDKTGLLYPIDNIGCNFLDAPNHEALLNQIARFTSTSGGTPEQIHAFLDGVLEALPEVNITPVSAWECLQRLLNVHIPTHQNKGIVLLPPELKELLRFKGK